MTEKSGKKHTREKKMNSLYTGIYVGTFCATAIKACVCVASITGLIKISIPLWLIFLTLESATFMGLGLTFDPHFSSRSCNHNIYRTFIVSLSAKSLTVWMMVLFAVYGFVNAQVPLMTDLFFCLPIWLTLLVSFFELQKTYKSD